MFVDRVKIHIKGGNGGNGMVSFYRATVVQMAVTAVVEAM